MVPEERIKCGQDIAPRKDWEAQGVLEHVG